MYNRNEREQLTVNLLEGKFRGAMLSDHLLVKKNAPKYCRVSSRSKGLLNSELLCGIKQQKYGNRDFWRQKKEISINHGGKLGKMYKYLTHVGVQ